MSQTHFPLDESKLSFSIPKDEKPREKIMKLGQMITDRVPAKLRPLTVEDPEYWGLDVYKRQARRAGHGKTAFPILEFVWECRSP